MTTIEFHKGYGEKDLVAVVEAEAVPRVGDFISIRKVTWIIETVTWAVDHADKILERQLRACCTMRRARKGEQP